MKSEIPRTDKLRDRYNAELISGIEIIEAHENLERELNEMRKALDELHVVVECAPGDIIHDWYCTDPLASQARETALQILNRRLLT